MSIADSAPALPLAGITVVEFCHTIMGPTAGLLLADMGAEVIKIEPTEGDRTRRLPGFAAGFFGSFNRNKRSLGVDIKSAGGKGVVHALVTKADVVLENFAPGTMERLDCDYETLRAMNPGLIFCSLKGFLSGPYEHRPALDEVVQFMAGLAYMTGPPGQPLRAGTSVVDIMGGTFAVVAILAALRERDSTGEGQLVKSALFESTAFLMGQHMAGYSITGRPVPPMPAREGAWAVYEPFETQDGQQVFVGLTSDNHWRRFCETFQCDDLVDDPRYASNEARVKMRSTLLPLVAEIVRQHPLAALCETFDRIGIPFSPVARTEDLFDDPHLNDGNRLLDVELGNDIKTKLPKLPIEMGGHDFGLRRQPPIAGEHSVEILTELGMSGEEITALVGRGEVLSGKRD
ncbi:MAG: CoA transferase [Gammaproteobacteria bacterium]|nr:CoA transferase [Gammaproteobacteria bacterium]